MLRMFHFATYVCIWLCFQKSCLQWMLNNSCEVFFSFSFLFETDHPKHDEQDTDLCFSRQSKCTRRYDDPDGRNAAVLERWISGDIRGHDDVLTEVSIIRLMIDALQFPLKACHLPSQVSIYSIHRSTNICSSELELLHPTQTYL